MSEPLTVAVAQPVCVPGDVGANAVAHAAAIDGAEAGLVVFPELSLTGYSLAAPTIDLHDARLAAAVDACARTGSTALVGAPVHVGDARFIAMLVVCADEIAIGYCKTFLGGDEPASFRAGPGAARIDVAGWRVGIGICSDTRTPKHVDDTVALGIDLYVAGLVHRPDELDEQDARAARIVDRAAVPVAFASAAGVAGPRYEATAGHSCIWAADGTVLARAGATPGVVVSAALS